MSKSLSFNNTSLAIIDKNNQPWLASSEITKALGYKDAKSVSRIYSRNSDEFTESMTQVVNLTPSKGTAGETRIFSPRGCHLIAMFSRTSRAKEFRKWVLDILENQQPQLEKIKRLTPEQAGHLKMTVDAIQKSTGIHWQTTWTRLNNNFGVSSYREIKMNDYPMACQFLCVKPLGDSVKDTFPITYADIVNLKLQLNEMKKDLLGFSIAVELMGDITDDLTKNNNIKVLN